MTPRSGLILPVLLVLAALAAVPAQAQQTQRQYLSGRDAGEPRHWDFFCTAGQNSGKWTAIPVPACWEPLGFGTYDYGHRKLEMPGEQASEQGLYKTKFIVPTDWKARRVFIVFDGVMTDAEVKINGQSAGPVHQGAFYRFKYEVGSLLKFGGENLLEVTVSKDSANPSVNTAERHGDYWNFGGIFRPVWLEAVPQRFIERVAIDARHDGSFRMNAYLNGPLLGAAAQGPGLGNQLELSIQDAGGRQVATAQAATLTSATLTATVKDPAAWTAETPNLYTAVVRLRHGDKTIHELRQRFGFRTIEVRPRDGIYVNGVKVVLKGVDRHSFWPDTGRALGDMVHRLDIDTMKDMNMNAVRMSHYPPDEQFLELCDEFGLYVLDELSGWQHCYTDTAHAKTLVEAMVKRDVNHPCILFWDNGNEGGWNNALNGEFAKWDPQQRNVLHPWELFGGVNTKHYPKYNELIKLLESGSIIMPTEFIHGLYDGGHGAGLEDYWSVMTKYPNLGGGFLWVLADEGVKRTDLKGAIDVQGNQGPDGIVGPYRQREGSFYTIKRIWSPVQVGRVVFQRGASSVELKNSYAFTNLKQCAFEWQMRKFGEKPGFEVIKKGEAASPDVAPGASGVLTVTLPADWRSADALALIARNPKGKELWTWVWPTRPAPAIASSMVPAAASEEGKVDLKLDPQTGALQGVSVQGKSFSLTSGPLGKVKWTQLGQGWVKVDFDYDPATSATTGGVAGLALSYPEEKMKSKTWLGKGPFRVWRNRLAGGVLGVYETPYNATQTGYTEWNYPEFAGYFAGVRWLKLRTAEGTLTLVNPDDKAFVRVGTPAQPDKKLAANTWIDFPQGNLAVVRDLPAIGNKFHKAEETGPQGATPLAGKEPFHGTFYLRFEP